VSDNLPMRGLDAQLDQIKFLKSDLGKRYTVTYCEDGGLDERAARVMWEGQLDILHWAETYCVSADVGEVLAGAAPTLPNFSLHPDDLPSPVGWVWFEDGIPMLDRRGHTMVVKGFSWGTVTLDDNIRDVADNGPSSQIGIPKQDRIEKALASDEAKGRNPGVIVFAYTDPNDERDDLTRDLRETFGATDDHIRRLPGLYMGHWFPVAYGDDWTVDRDRNRKAGAQPMSELLVAFWRFIQEPWIDGRMMLPGRPATRRNRAAGRPEPNVRVVRLRRAEARTRREREEGEEPVETLWSHRWIVKGHWRNQWYPSMQQHRPRWIPRHIKGPEHLPLVVHDTVFLVDR
jgi:hypothetical protein